MADPRAIESLNQIIDRIQAVADETVGSNRMILNDELDRLREAVRYLGGSPLPVSRPGHQRGRR